MEIIIIIAVLGLAAYWVYDMSQKKKDTTSDQPWPFGEKLSEGKIHVKPADVAGSANRVETTAPVVTNSDPVDNVPVTASVKKPAAAKKAPAKKTAAKPAAAKKAPAKKKSI
jgi:hypothetical protein